MPKNYSNISEKKAIAICANHKGKTASIRTETISSSAKWNSAADHNQRATKKACLSSVNDNGVYVYDGLSAPTPLDNQSIIGKQKADALKALYKPYQAQHRVLVKENGTKHTRFNNPEINGNSKDIRQSFAESVIYFGADQEDTEGNIITQSHLAKLIELEDEPTVGKRLLILARTAMEKMAKRFNFELLGDATIHLDEEGQMHVHQLHTNFNKDTGASPNFGKKIGATMQTMIANEFKEVGFKRGVPYEIQKIAGLNPQGNIPIRAYKELQEAKNQVDATVLANKREISILVAKGIQAEKDYKRKVDKLEKNLERELKKANGLIAKGSIKYHKKKALGFETKLTAAKVEIATLTSQTHSQISSLEKANLEIESLKNQLETQHETITKENAVEAKGLFKTLLADAETKLTKDIQTNVIKPLQMDLQIEKREHQDTRNTVTALEEKQHLMLKDHQETGSLLQGYRSQFGTTEAYKKSSLGQTPLESNTIKTDFKPK